jgi:hypothetical protein
MASSIDETPIGRGGSPSADGVPHRASRPAPSARAIPRTAAARRPVALRIRVRRRQSAQKGQRNHGVQDFCRICKKCAVCCPSQSIPEGDPEEVNSSLRWKLNEMTCFDYWGKVGTDCNVCMRVCPWSHARTFPHRIIVWMVARNGVARRLFSTMDDLFYGKRPRPKEPPAWASFSR